MESPMLTRIKRKEQDQPDHMQILKEFIIFKLAVIGAAIITIFEILMFTKLG